MLSGRWYSSIVDFVLPWTQAAEPELVLILGVFAPEELILLSSHFLAKKVTEYLPCERKPDRWLTAYAAVVGHEGELSDECCHA